MESQLESYQKEYIDVLLSSRVSNDASDQLHSIQEDYFFQHEPSFRVTSYTPRASGEVSVRIPNSRFSVGQGRLVYAEPEQSGRDSKNSVCIEDVQIRRLRNSELQWMSNRTFRSSRNMRDLLQPSLDFSLGGGLRSSETGDTNFCFQKKDLGALSLLHRIFKWKSPESLPVSLSEDWLAPLEPVSEPLTADAPVAPMPRPTDWMVRPLSGMSPKQFTSRTDGLPRTKRSFLIRKFITVAERKLSFRRGKTRSSEHCLHDNFWSPETRSEEDYTLTFRPRSKTTFRSIGTTTMQSKDTQRGGGDDLSQQGGSFQFERSKSVHCQTTEMSTQTVPGEEKTSEVSKKTSEDLVNELGLKLRRLESETRMRFAIELMRSMHPDQIT